MTGGRQVQTHQDVVTEAQNGGFITTQKLNITMAAAVDKVDYMCQATNQDLFETVHKVVTVSVMCKPNKVNRCHIYSVINTESNVFHVTFTFTNGFQIMFTLYVAACI